MDTNITISFFGDLTPIFTTEASTLANHFPNPDFNISNFIENIGPRESLQGMEIKCISKRYSIKVYFNRVDFLFKSPIRENNDYFNNIDSFVGLFNLKFNRIAVNSATVISDKDDSIKRKLVGNLLQNDSIGSQTTELAFKIAKVLMHGSEEINSLYFVEDAYIQKIRIKNNLAIPSLEKALVIKTDVNTTQKNVSERFLKSNYKEFLSFLIDESRKQIDIIINYLETL